MLRIQTRLTTLLTIILIGNLSAQTPEALVGKWRSIEDSGKQVEFFHGADNLYHGKVINSVNKSIPNGHLLFKNGVYVPADHTIKGFLSSPGRSLEIDATIIFITQDKLKVIGRTFLITKTLFFDRII